VNGELSNRSIWRTLLLASFGGALEFYDFVIFVFFTGVIGNLFFPPGIPAWSRQLQTYGLLAAGYFARPAGGLVMAHFGDTKGRKKMFTLSILMMAAPTFLIALLPTYAKAGLVAPILLLLLRLLQGAAIGGEAPAAWVFVSEHAQRGKYGLAVGILTSGLSLGILLGSVTATSLNILFTPAQLSHDLWRIPFAFGGMLGLIAAFLRRWLTETPVFQAMRAQIQAARSQPLKTVLTSHRRAVAKSIVSTSSLTAGIVVSILMTPSLLHQLFHIPTKTTQIAGLFATAALCFATVIIGWASDRLGVRLVAAISVPFFILSNYALYLAARNGTQHLAAWYSVAGLGAGCTVLTPIVILRMFPTSVRFTGFALGYNLAYAVFGGIAPLIVSSLSTLTSLAAPHYVAVASILGLVVSAGRLGRRGGSTELSEDSQVAPEMSSSTRSL
jgi:MFS family permease